MKRIIAAFIVTLTLLSFPLIGSAGSLIQYYRYSKTNKTGDIYFVREVHETKKGKTYYRVELDDIRRISKTTRVENGREGWTCQRKYDGAGRRYNQIICDSPKSDMNEINTFYRDREGRIIKQEILDGKNNITLYSHWKHLPGSIEIQNYTKDGKEDDKIIYYYDSDGEMVTLKGIKPGMTINWEIDPRNGLQTEGEACWDDLSRVKTKLFYDPEGLLVRQEFYDITNRVMLEIIEYKDGLRSTDKSFRKDGNVHLFRYEYDNNWLLKAVWFFRNDKLVCRFDYKRFPNGTIKDTLAYSERGELLAEYPDRNVHYIDEDGSAQDGRESRIYKTGTFW